ncbi:sushi, nidogen and EGF-like domain-containing protein 1 [Physella acuta]|uniref:sushi, nidogen and EGF-like domain-containing protein 1 n=1 Tax=Physella acuta TaxID=109671 RepID=UPI0027DD4B61|nr:sushi, nidogen and EGF-like domain-containing protein 1 [Physella acuta]
MTAIIVITDAVNSRVSTTTVRSRDPCRYVQCQNGASCWAPLDVAQCVCQPNFTGRLCEVSLFKPGTCPEVPFVPFIPTCTSPLCQADPDCPGEQKCCQNSCGSSVCTDPRDLPRGPTCNGGCQPGYSCILQMAQCPPELGIYCLPAMLEVCVPDGCVSCQSDQECRQVSRCGSQHFAAGRPCVEKFKCVKKRDPCGGCPTNQICLKLNTTSNHDGPRHVCVPNDDCGGCPPGQTCQTFALPCRDPCEIFNFQDVPVPCNRTVDCTQSSCVPDLVNSEDN